MSGYKEYYEIENIFEELLRKEAIGPIKEDEVLEEEPTQFYSLGILWPQRTDAEAKAISIDESEPEEDISLENSKDLGDIDIIGDMEEAESRNDFYKANVFRPSSMAISAVIDKEERTLTADFYYATYTLGYKEVEYTRKRINGDEEIEEKAVRRQEQYTRVKSEPIRLIIDTNTGEILEGGELLSRVDIQLFVRKIYEDGSRLVTLSVLNKATAQKENINPLALFQCRLVIRSNRGFLPIASGFFIKGELEQELLELLYRNEKNYAIGHGCSVSWKKEKDKIYCISSEFLPVEELRQMKPRSLPEIKAFNMSYWLKANRSQGLQELLKFISFYETWYDNLRTLRSDISGYKRAIDYCFNRIELCIKRLKQGVETLSSNEPMWKAFVYMNEAMALQRVNYGKTKGKSLDFNDVSWYPFQLAYILQIIPDIAEESSSYRDFVDLLWFPTGGGKTEAYLGLSAITIFYRRLTKGEQAAGVTILMRYTLRLLTTQQFERAAALICACEAMRRKYGFSSEEISIGLWVGMDLTPNTLMEAKEKLTSLREGDDVYKGNPKQIHHCPYCGQELDLGAYKVHGGLNIQCPSPDCLFNEGLPIYVVDEDIYKARPTLLLSTVDKLARIVWEEKTLALFAADGKNLPPELIIQDELHLISGPLGSLAGLYEIAVDGLCTTKAGRKPKIIASTATVRNAEKQIKSLYNRETLQFPPNGLSHEDSFFAIMATPEERPARRYLGICEMGGNQVDVLIRVYGCMIYAINYLKAKGVRDEIIDQYFTLVGYFNTLKDLGSSATILLDHVRIYSTALMLHKFKDYSQEVGLKEIDINFYSELTSRKSSEEIKETLEELEISYPDERAYSYVLASNMLSVGIDVGRLGIMTVYSQPKTTAEYIQATSRVGRSNPGLVITFYNSMRTRDRSHYEQFSYYHRTFYKYVEPTSVTPFSFRAVEKALHAVYVALIRHRARNMASNDAVRNFNSNAPEIIKIKADILKRIRSINPEAEEYAELWLQNFEELWEEAAEEKSDIFYYSLKNMDSSLVYTLLNEAEKEVNSVFPSTLNSLRNVDGSSNVYLLEREEEGN